MNQPEPPERYTFDPDAPRGEPNQLLFPEQDVTTGTEKGRWMIISIGLAVVGISALTLVLQSNSGLAETADYARPAVAFFLFLMLYTGEQWARTVLVISLFVAAVFGLIGALGGFGQLGDLGFGMSAIYAGSAVALSFSSSIDEYLLMKRFK